MCFVTEDFWGQGWGKPGGYSITFYEGGLRPEVQPLYPFLYHFCLKRYPFCIPFIDKWYPLRIPHLELCIPFLTAVNALSSKYE